MPEISNKLTSTELDVNDEKNDSDTENIPNNTSASGEEEIQGDTVKNGVPDRRKNRNSKINDTEEDEASGDDKLFTKTKSPNKLNTKEVDTSRKSVFETPIHKTPVSKNVFFCFGKIRQIYLIEKYYSSYSRNP